MNKQLLPVGTLLHNKTLRIERQLSSGSFGNTYVVTKTAFNETFALKEFFIRGVNTRVNETVTVSVDDNKGTFQSQRRKFANEAQRLHGVNHPNIVHVTDFFEMSAPSPQCYMNLKQRRPERPARCQPRATPWVLDAYTERPDGAKDSACPCLPPTQKVMMP